MEKHIWKQHNTKSGRNNLTIKKVVSIVLIVIILFSIIMAVVNMYLYVVESKVDPNNPYPVKGVDVSSYQKDVDWKGLEEEGYSFAFIKATEGTTHVDPRFEENWKEANKTKMRVGAYHFLSYDSEGTTQAENFINMVDSKWGMLPPAVDVEMYGKYSSDHPGKKELRGKLNVVLEELEKHYGMRPIIYTNRHIYSEYIAGKYDEYDVWISDPDITPELSDGRQWVFCQYTFEGVSDNVAGGEKKVDLNVFCGTKWDLRKYDGK